MYVLEENNHLILIDPCIIDIGVERNTGLCPRGAHHGRDGGARHRRPVRGLEAPSAAHHARAVAGHQGRRAHFQRTRRGRNSVILLSTGFARDKICALHPEYPE